jgi:hypothetical protein
MLGEEADTMATTIRRTRQRGPDLSAEERRCFFDQQARAIVGVSGPEFLRRWDAGEFRAEADDPDYPGLMHLVLLIPFGR